MIRPAALVAAAALLLAACGGAESYAGLTRDEADERISAALARAKVDGTIQREVGRALAGTSGEAMGRAGGRPLGSIGPTAARDGGRLAKRTAPGGAHAWVRSYALAGLGSAVSLCVYAWDGGDDVRVRSAC